MTEVSTLYHFTKTYCKNTGHVKGTEGVLKMDPGSDASHDHLFS